MEDETLFDDVTTMDESWMYCYGNANKQSTSQWQLRGAEPPIKQKAIKSRDKALAITFFDKQVVLYTNWMWRDTKDVNKKCFIKIFRQLKRVHIPKKRLEWKDQNVKIHADNVRLHTAKVVSDYLCKASFIIVPHPPYSRDLAPNDFFCTPL